MNLQQLVQSHGRLQRQVLDNDNKRMEKDGEILVKLSKVKERLDTLESARKRQQALNVVFSAEREETQTDMELPKEQPRKRISFFDFFRR